ncbi:hypothetical protein BDU57DRAFT_528334 [Ampelomyces quisqualis]|uniref:Uncharacterized protein n=1 Tax=Ampelomyces quisqualis TaxID=50730 RepID=A0A6A5QSG3_AMPQU|nr:hypothetical protein BDU57DRAFT_528334 [Ampelomyces quisqualis]
MDLGRSIYKWFKHNWVLVVLSVIALILDLVLYTKRRQIQRRFINAIETLCVVGQRTCNTIPDWKVPPPADEEPAFELDTQSAPPTPAKDCSMPKTLLGKHRDAIQNCKVWQHDIGAIDPKKAALKVTFLIAKPQSAVPCTIKAASPGLSKAASPVHPKIPHERKYTVRLPIT